MQQVKKSTICTFIGQIHLGKNYSKHVARLNYAILNKISIFLERKKTTNL